MKKLLLFFVCVLLLNGNAFSQTVYDDKYAENPNYLKGLEYLESSQYSSAIAEFKKAIRTNPQDDSALIGLSNAYNLRAKYYNDNLKEPDKAITDLKSALFFNKYFRQHSSNSSAQAIANMEKNLKILETALHISEEPDKIFQTAKSERTKGEFAAAAYDFYRLSGNSKYRAEANSSIGDIYKIFNRSDKAIVFYQNSLAADSKNTEVHLKLARAYEDLGDFNTSLKEYSFALDTSSEREDILSSLERIWQKKVDENPNDAEAHANLGVVFQKEKRFNEALDEYKKAEALNPSNTNTKVNIATLYQEQKKYDMALSVYNSILQTLPKNTNILTYKAQCLKELKKTDEAIETYKTVLNLDPKNTAARTELFSLLKNSMSNEEVLAFLYQNVLNSPNEAEAYYEFAYELHKAGKIDDAITYYNQTVKMDKENIDAYINLSQCYRQKKRYADAYAAIKKAVEIDPTNNLVKEQLAAVEKDYAVNIYNAATNAFESGNYETAIEMYSKVSPQTVDSVLGIAASYQALNNNAKAIEFYKQAMALDEKNSDIPYYIAALYANAQDMENAQQYTKIALSKNPSNTQAKELEAYITSKNTEGLLEQAVKVYEEEKYEEAVALFDKIIKINPNDSTVYYYRALSYDALKNYSKAISDYKTVIKISPQMTIANYSIAVDYDNLENYKAAKEFYKKYVDSIPDDNEYKQYAQTRLKELSE